MGLPVGSDQPCHDAPFPTHRPAPPAALALCSAGDGDLLLTAWLPPAALAASIPGLPVAAAPAAPAKQPDGSKAIQAELDEARRDASVVENSPNCSANAPANTPDEELEAAPAFPPRNGALLRKPPAQQRCSRVRCASSSKAKRQVETWTSLETSPPHSVLLADRLTQAAVSAQNRVKSLVTARI